MANPRPVSYNPNSMTNVTHILSAIEQGDSHAAEQLLPLVYDELRKLAAQKKAQEKPGQTLQATALVRKGVGSLLRKDSRPLLSRVVRVHGRGRALALGTSRSASDLWPVVES